MRRIQVIAFLGTGLKPALALGLGMVWWLCMANASPALGAPEPVEPATEYEVKAALLLRMARFTEWPVGAFGASNAPFVIGVIGRDPFGTALEKTFSGKSLNGRSIVVKRLGLDQDLKQCQLLFVSASEKRRERDILDRLKNAPVLTIGDHDEFLDHGGMVDFHIVDNTVRFSVNLNAAKMARLRIDAKVLQFATSVRGRYE